MTQQPSRLPTEFEYLIDLGRRHHQAGRMADAEQAYREVLAIRPDAAEVHNDLGGALAAQGQFAAAKLQFQRAVALEPTLVQAHSNLGNILAAEGRRDEAVARYRLAIALKPDAPIVHNNLANVYKTLGKFDEAAAHYQRAIALRPSYAAAHANLANLLKDQGRLAEAAAEYQRALALDPKLAEAHDHLGNVLRDQGQLDAAAAEYERALAIKPDLADAHYDRAIIKTFHAGDRELAELEALAAGSDRLSVDDSASIHFALGKALDDVGQYRRAFDAWAQANALKRRQIDYREAEHLAAFRRVAETFDAQLLARFAHAGNLSPAPIFILGMPRSGSTLVEQILASHPEVHGAGELGTLGRLADVAGDSSGRPVPFPDYVPRLNAEDWSQLGQAYLAGLPALPAGKARISDKTPSNFWRVGLIRLILPNAIIIHTVRDPADTCFSCFSTMFRNGQPYCYDLAELGRYYRHYQGLMDHWRRTLPLGAMLEVRYEDVVNHLEEQARRLLDHCGLPWHDGCLSFYRTQRPVSTASAVQVRRPIYRDSLQRWRHYEAQLGPLLAELDGHGSAS